MNAAASQRGNEDAGSRGEVRHAGTGVHGLCEDACPDPFTVGQAENPRGIERTQFTALGKRLSSSRGWAARLLQAVEQVLRCGAQFLGVMPVLVRLLLVRG
jgi:hypothetical protein